MVIIEKLRYEIKLTSGDLLDMKRFEPAMRHLLDMYVRADDSEVLRFTLQHQWSGWMLAWLNSPRCQMAQSLSL
ncbi:hypothetical protein QU831_11170 [Escherichia coli]|uniref:hypothetical protein n=1 Tax=Escherichia coli TaxID=562 RepID=UPI00263353AA|nr:hypothetical protein [Escherichia coli]WKB05952.1 hypothetical protein QU831_11170 [Escherichia coli]